VQEDLVSKPWVLMARPVLDPNELAEAVRVKLKERTDMLNICQSSLVRKMQGRTGEIIERPGWKVANDAEVRGRCISNGCPEVAPFVCSLEACKAYCCSVHGPDHQLHATWATVEALTVQRDQRKAAAVIANPLGHGRGARSGRGGRGGRVVLNVRSGAGRVAGESQPRIDKSTSAGGEGEGTIRGRGRSRGGLRGSTRGGGRGRGRSDNVRANSNVADVDEESVPSGEVNPMALLAGLLRSHPNLLSQLTTMGSANTSEENTLDEWIL
jgi:hypothetical protein